MRCKGVDSVTHGTTGGMRTPLPGGCDSMFVQSEKVCRFVHSDVGGQRISHSITDKRMPVLSSLLVSSVTRQTSQLQLAHQWGCPRLAHR